jgi:hypothetical protein
MHGINIPLHGQLDLLVEIIAERVEVLIISFALWRQKKLLTWSADCWTFSLRSLKDSKWKTPARYALSAPSVMIMDHAS